MKKIVLSVALTGAITPKSKAPALPILPDEIAADAVRCVKAGAAICHLHARTPDGVGTMNVDIFREIYEKTRAALDAEGLDAIINLTTSGGKGTDEERVAHLKALRPEMCSYDAGTINWAGDGVFINSPQFLKMLGKLTMDLKIKPEIEIFDSHMIRTAARYGEEGFLQKPLHFQLVLGTYGGVEATVKNLARLKSKLPEGSTFSVTGCGAGSVPMLMAALAIGADGVRVGLEDNVYMSKGVPATNLQQVERARDIIETADFAIATPAEARELLHFPK